MYEEKCRRVDRALMAMFDRIAKPDVLALGEITEQAARELRDRILPGYQVISLDTLSGSPSLQIALLLMPQPSNAIKFSEAPPIVVPGTPRGTRPMAVLDVASQDWEIRIVTCHWQAQFDDASELTRLRSADHLSRSIFEFIEGAGSRERAVIVMGDLNEEPFGKPLSALNAHRHRARSQGRVHWADKDVERVHLYNASWRFLGEKYDHAPNAPHQVVGSAGTYFWEAKKSWASLDHLIVSGRLLADQVPFLDESMTQVVTLPEFLTDGLPLKFVEDLGKMRGVSDHLPIFARIAL